MIDINLLPIKDRKKKMNVGNPTFAPFVLGSVILFMIASYNLMEFQKEFLNEELKVIEEQQRTISISADKINQLDNEINRIKSNFQVAINKFKTSDMWVTEVETIQDVIPRDMWLSDLEYSTGMFQGRSVPETESSDETSEETQEFINSLNSQSNKHYIKGYSFSYKGISSFVKNLKNSNDFRDVIIFSLEEKKFEQRIEYIEFVLILKRDDGLLDEGYPIDGNAPDLDNSLNERTLEEEKAKTKTKK